jgi:autotransporter-associated beta strand protein
VPDDPADTATFDFSNITGISQSQRIDVAEIIFQPGASAFTITSERMLHIYGTGVTNNSGMMQNFVAPGQGTSIHFHNSATAGENTVFTQASGSSVAQTKIAFHDTSSAGSATFINQGNAQAASGTRFYDSATAASGTFINQAGTDNGGCVFFFNTARAGSATFVCEGTTSVNRLPAFMDFDNRSSAEDATITINGASTDGVSPGFLEFYNRASAGNAKVIANGGTARRASGGSISFYFSTPTADNATFIINGGTNGGLGGRLEFWSGSLGGTAQVKVFDNGTVDLSNHDRGTVSIGSIAGTGLVLLGTTNLIVGTNNFTTAFSGSIRDSALPPGASFTKIGSGNLTLTSPNAYEGGTFVQGPGVLFVNNLTGSGTGSGTVQVNSGVLGGNGIISGPVVVGNGNPGGARLMPGKTERSPGMLRIEDALTFNGDSTYLWMLDTVRVVASSVVTKGVTIDSAALFSPAELQSGVLTVGTVFTVIDNIGAAAIVGSFSNLPDGATITIGSNNFQANYEGGDGNDLTLTVVP